MKINALSILLVGISASLYGAAEPQAPSLIDLGEVPIKTIGQYLRSDKDLFCLALVSTSIAKLLHDPLAERKAGSLIKYWKEPAQCVYREANASLEIPVKALAFSPDNKLLAYGTSTEENIVDIKTGRNVWRDFSGKCERLIFPNKTNSPAQLVDCTLPVVRRSTIARCDDPEHLVLTQTGEFRIPFIHKPVIALSRDGKLTAGAGTSAKVRVWDENGQLKEMNIKSAQSAELKITALAFSPDGNELAIGDNEGKVTLWNLATGQITLTPICDTNNSKSYISSLDFSPDGKQLVAICMSKSWGDGAIMLWNRQSNEPPYCRPEIESSDCAAFSPDGKIVAFTWPEHGIGLMDVESHEIINTLTVAQGTHIDPKSVKFSPNGKLIASGLGPCMHNSLAIWSIGATTIKPHLRSLDAIKKEHAAMQQRLDALMQDQNLPCSHQSQT